jgi:predicted Rossmann fold flavoprotein
MKHISVLVIGGGAAGLVAAISAKRRGAKTVLVCEKMPRIGKKILASGNGRCNLSHEGLRAEMYNELARGLVDAVFARFGEKDIADFFAGLGLLLVTDNGRVFPVTQQASSVLKALEMELARLFVEIRVSCDITALSRSAQGFVARTKDNFTVTADTVIFACGGKAYPALGADGSAYQLAKKLGHTIVEPVPAAVPLLVKNMLCHILQGQRISASAKAIVRAGCVAAAHGELLFTQYGVSGTAILDVSRPISVALHRSHTKDVCVSLDLVPFLEETALRDVLRARHERGITPENLLIGIVPNKFALAFKDLLKTCDCGSIARTLKDLRLPVAGTKSWNEAEFTSGGVSIDEICEGTLESRLEKGLYFAGEALDVDGPRGGYNLAWAWASGFVAGLGGKA